MTSSDKQINNFISRKQKNNSQIKIWRNKMYQPKIKSILKDFL